MRTLLLATALAAAGEISARPDGKPLAFADIRPILERRCIDCHTGWFPKAGLRLDSREAILEGGRSGPAVVPGKPEKGWLVYTITPGENVRSPMPPDGPPLTEEEIGLLKEWIRQGAH